MSYELRFGAGDPVTIETGDGEIFGFDAALQFTPLDDPAAAVAAAMDEPLDFPPISQAITDEDQVAIAVDPRTPCVGEVVAGLVQALNEGERQPAGITVVLANAEPGAMHGLSEALDARLEGNVKIETHDPADTAQLVYLCAARDAEPVYFNRTMVDADVVLPVGVLRLDESLGSAGIHSGLFPAFSDEATQRRFRLSANGKPTTASHRKRRREEADEAAWLLGVQFTVQIIPGGGETVLHVLAGDANTVARQGAHLCEAAWLRKTPQQAEMVIATIEGGPAHQTWENFGRALYAASQAVEDDGAIVICSEIGARPGPGLQRLMAPIAEGESDRVLGDMQQEQPFDAVPAAMIVQATRRARVYLLSELEPEIVEELGMAYVESAADVQRLGRTYKTCLVLNNAHYAMADATQADAACE